MAFWDMGVTDAVSAGLSLGGSVFSAVGGSKTNKANAKEAQKQRDWQERMSNTAHQREVDDLRRAGLNPILSAGGSGASVGPGASASMINPFSGAAEAGNSAARLMAVEKAKVNLEAKALDKNIEKTDTEIKLNESALDTQKTQQDMNRAIEGKNQAESMLLATNADIAAGRYFQLLPLEKELLHSQSVNQLQQGSANSAYAVDSLTAAKVKELELNKRRISKDIEPYAEAYRIGTDALSDTGEAIWNLMPHKKGMPDKEVFYEKQRSNSRSGHVETMHKTIKKP